MYKSYFLSIPFFTQKGEFVPMLGLSGRMRLTFTGLGCQSCFTGKGWSSIRPAG